MGKSEEIIIISEQSYNIESSLENTAKTPLDEIGDEVKSCLFTFRYMESSFAFHIILLLKNMVSEFLYNLDSKNANNLDEIIIKYNMGCDFKIIESSTDSNISYKQDKFFIFMHSNAKNIINFSNMLSNLPLSLFFTFQNLEFLQDFVTDLGQDSMKDSIPNTFKDSKDNIINIETFCNFLESSNKYIPNIIDLQNIKQNYKLIRNFITINNKDSIESIIKTLINKLIKNHSITIKKDNKIFRLHLENSPKNLDKKDRISDATQVIFTDLYNATSYLRISQAQKNLIATFEAPLILLQPKSAFKNLFMTPNNASKNASSTDFSEIFATLPSDAFLMLLFYTIQKDYNKDFLFLENISQNIDVCDLIYTQNYKNLSFKINQTNEILKSSEPLKILASSKDLRFVTFSYINGDIFTLLNANKNTDNSRFILLLSQQNPSVFWLENISGDGNYSEILNISFSLDLEVHLKKLYSYENGDKLLKNFVKAHSEIATTWRLDSDFANLIELRNDLSLESKSKSQKSSKSNNLIDIFMLIKKLLNLPKDVLEYASECVRDRGPRIDFKLKREGDCIILDYARILRSILSFYLAGVEIELISYGVIESMCEFIGTLCGDMLVNYGVKNVLVCGDMLLWQVFLDKIIYAIPKNINLNFPSPHATDYRI